MSEIKALTSLRGVAAMAVVLQHFSATAQSHAAVNIPSLVPHGYLAVDLFFVLSGFIMAYTYLNDFRRRRLSAFGAFLAKRVARIVPLNCVTLALIVIAGIVSDMLLNRNIFHQSQNIWFDLPMNILMLQGVGLGLNLNGPSWSISTEFAAYLVFPVLLILMFSSRVVAGLSLAVAAMALVLLALSRHRLGLDTTDIVSGLIRCFAGFVFGLGVYRAIQVGWIARILRADWPAILIAAWILCWVLLRIDLPAVLAFPALVGALACNRRFVAALFSVRPLYFLGEISFSLYLLHDMFRPFALTIVRAWHPELLNGPAAMGFALIGSLAIIPFAWLAYVIVERPGRRLLRTVVPARGFAIWPLSRPQVP